MSISLAPPGLGARSVPAFAALLVERHLSIEAIAVLVHYVALTRGGRPCTLGALAASVDMPIEWFRNPLVELIRKELIRPIPELADDVVESLAVRGTFATEAGR